MARPAAPAPAPAGRRVPVDATVLRMAREAAGLSQDALARRAGVVMNTVSRLERGVHPAARLETVRRLARALGVPMADLQKHEEG